MSTRPLTRLALNGKNLKDTDNIFEDLLRLKDLTEVIENIRLINFP
jgi:hypothetical protein